MNLSPSDKEWIMMALDPLKKDISHMNKHLEGINGRINKHDEMLKEYNIRTNLIEKAEVAHVVNCPVNPKIREVEDTLLTFMTEMKVNAKTKNTIFTKTNSIIAIIIIVATFCLGIYNATMNTKMNKNNVTVENKK